MKLMILGIDAGDLKIFEHMDMPYLKTLILKNKVKHLQEDLINRGWAEMISGKYARDNDSFYIKPLCDGTTNFTLKYSYSDLKSNNDGPLIWEIVEGLGEKVGIMNIPTTYPAPKVNGFFVSGAGGGLYSVDGVPDDMCSSTELKNLLEKENYELELRFKPSGIKDINMLFDKMNSMMEKRFQVFIQLSQRENIALGFLALRATANLQYVIMSEIERFIKKKSQLQVWKENISKHFKLLDQNIEKMFSSLNVNEFVITADHGLSPQRYHANYNIILKELNYLNYHPNSFYQRSKNLVKEVLNSFFKEKYIIDKGGNIDWDNTLVFGQWYSNALYINDEKRFSGPVKLSDIEKLANEICEKFNSHKVSKEFQVEAIPYKSKFKDSKYFESLPDIKLIASDEIFYTGRGKEAIYPSPWYGEIKTLKNIPTSMYTGTKGSHPIFLYSNGLDEFIYPEDKLDLTLVYKITERLFKSKSE